MKKLKWLLVCYLDILGKLYGKTKFCSMLSQHRTQTSRYIETHVSIQLLQEVKQFPSLYLEGMR